MAPLDGPFTNAGMPQRAGSISHGFGFSSLAVNGGTEFMSIQEPPKGAVTGWDNTRSWNQQTITNIPPVFRDAMSVREEVYGEQGVPLEAEFDEDDARSFHWVAYASVGTSSSPPKSLTRYDSGSTPAEDARRASATAQRTPIGTIRLIPPPHGPNKYIEDKHSDADPPKDKEVEHTSEPYVKLGRLAVLKDFRGNNLSNLLITHCLKFAAEQPDVIYLPPSPTTQELANYQGSKVAQPLSWRGLVMIHAQVQLKSMWEKHGFHEELRNDNGEVEIAAEPHWMEEGIEHVGMWKRLKVAAQRL